ncbi:MAG: M23 family metallopeptidase [Rhodothalassiaceae bacterium]
MHRSLGGALLAALLSFPALAVELRGTLAQGGLVVGRADPGARALLDGEELPVTGDGWFVFGFGRDAPLDHSLIVIESDGRRTRHDFRLEDREFPVEHVDGLPPRTVTIPPEEQGRRAREAAMVARARAATSDLRHWTGSFIRPAEGRISGVYGSQRILNGEPRSLHYGLDIAAPTGTEVVAPAAGIVRLAEPDFLLEGGIIIIDHGFGVSSTLFHLARVDVRVGDRVAQGDPVGAIGATGRASGPHVDWRVNWRDVRIDPALLVAGEAAP